MENLSNISTANVAASPCSNAATAGRATRWCQYCVRTRKSATRQPTHNGRRGCKPWPHTAPGVRGQARRKVALTLWSWPQATRPAAARVALDSNLAERSCELERLRDARAPNRSKLRTVKLDWSNKSELALTLCARDDDHPVGVEALTSMVNNRHAQEIVRVRSPQCLA